jgi:hypothetical protein
MIRSVTARAVAACLAAVLARDVAAQDGLQHVYVERTQGVETSHTLILRRNGTGVEIQWQAPDEDFITVCDNTGATREWRFHDSDTDIVARRSGNRIRLEGVDGDERISRELAIDGAPWFQPLSYALGRFSLSDRESVRFWAIRPDSLEVVKLLATRQDVESVATDAGSFSGRRVRISLGGLLSTFWKAHYWFRLDDGLFIRYEGVRGPPGTPGTVIELRS